MAKKSVLELALKKSQSMYIDMVVHGVAQYLCGIQMLRRQNPEYEIDVPALQKEVKQACKDRNLPVEYGNAIFDTIVEISKVVM